jgi:sugar/nucleoside kinase (ribokinase family)
MNDTEIRQYTGQYNLIEAGRTVIKQGPKVVLIKKGEHGAIALSEHGLFVTSAFPLDSPRDPTGAGDSFAGGFMGYLAATGDTSWAGIKRAMAYGSVVASFTVEDFSVHRLLSLSLAEVCDRYTHLSDITTLEAQVLNLLRS